MSAGNLCDKASIKDRLVRNIGPTAAQVKHWSHNWCQNLFKLFVSYLVLGQNLEVAKKLFESTLGWLVLGAKPYVLC